MATHAVAVARRAVGASHQKSWGDPNQQVGAITRNITGIHLAQILVFLDLVYLQVDMTVSSGKM